MDIQFGNLNQLNWLWLVMVVAITLVAAMIVRRRAIKQFATTNLLPRLFPQSLSRRGVVKSIVVLTAMSLLVLALIDVRWGKTWREVPQKGIDVVFALDVSRSMLADDVAPNRLDRAKQQIKDMVDAMAGDRVGLVVFAGDSRHHVPLTRHYHDFKNALDEVGPLDVERGGSELSRAIETAADAFLDKTDDHKAIVIFSDGEDLGSQPLEVATKIHKEQGIRIFTVGLGDPDRGALVPAPPGSGKRYMTYGGQPVRSKLNNAVLEQVAVNTEGAYIPAETKTVNMADIYHAYIANVEQQDFETARIKGYIPRFQIFVGLALALLLLEMFWPQRRARSLRNIVEAMFRPTRHRSLPGEKVNNKPADTETIPNDQQRIAA